MPDLLASTVLAGHPVAAQALVAALVLLVFVACVREWVSPDLAAMGAFVVLLLSGVLSKDDASAVFGTGAPIIVAAMFVLSAALERTGTIEAMGHWFERVAGNREPRVLLALLALVIPLSAFVNNTPVVVVLMPIVLKLCRRHDLKASRFLIPLSYAAIAGGTCTIIGTSTNVLASGIASDLGEAHAIPGLAQPFGMFEITGLGAVFSAVTALYLLTVGRRLLPDRVTLSTLFESEDGKEFLTEAVIAQASPLAGKRFVDTTLAKMRELRLIEIRRGFSRVEVPLNEVVFEAGDQLVFKSRASGVMGLGEIQGVLVGPREQLGLERLRTESAVLMEGIVGPRSRLVGRSLRELNLRQRFGVLVLAVHRRGENLRERFEKVTLAFGDTLLVEGPPEAMNRLFSERDLINLSRPRERPFRRSKARYAILALVGFMVFGALEVAPLLPLALAAVLLVTATRTIDLDEAYEAIEWRVVFMIFGMLGLGKGLEVSGLAQGAATAAVQAFGDYGPHVAVAAVYLIAALLTELISNNAVAALLTPVAIAVGLELGCDPRPLVVAVMFGASASFCTPIGYQTNTLVYGAGGYRFGDFARVGIPLSFLLWLVASLLIPVFWKL
jgi:di/tricarboxylate transporter